MTLPYFASFKPHTEWPHCVFSCAFLFPPALGNAAINIIRTHEAWVHVIYCMTTPRALHSALMEMCVFSGFKLLQNAAVSLSSSSPGDRGAVSLAKCFLNWHTWEPRTSTWHAGGKLEGLRGLQRWPRLWPPRQDERAVRWRAPEPHEQGGALWAHRHTSRKPTPPEGTGLHCGPLAITSARPLLTKPQRCQTSFLLKKEKGKTALWS